MGGGGGEARGREKEGKEMEYRVEREGEGGERGVKKGRVEGKESSRYVSSKQLKQVSVSSAK